MYPLSLFPNHSFFNHELFNLFEVAFEYSLSLSDDNAAVLLLHLQAVKFLKNIFLFLPHLSHLPDLNTFQRILATPIAMKR